MTSIGGGVYTASYDAAGDLTCRAPNSSVTCAGTPTGATLSYDAERRLAHWQNTPSSPTTQDDYLYDGAGNRVEQYVNTSGPISTTAYLLGGVEEISNGVVTKYLGAKGLPTAVRVGTSGNLNYLATDGLGSVSVAVDGSGNVVASQLFGPYGASRYSSGTMPTSRGFTGQRADATTGLDYYGARYYDPAAGQFTSADSVINGLSRYAYVGGNPETATDPSGHLVCEFNHCGGGGGGSGGCVHDCGGSGGNTQQCSGGNPKTCSSGGAGNPNDNINNGYDNELCGGKNPNCVFDANGACATEYTCNVEQTLAANKERDKGERDTATGEMLIIALELLGLLSDVISGADLLLAKDFLTLAAFASKYALPAATYFFGVNSWAVAGVQRIVSAFQLGAEYLNALGSGIFVVALIAQFVQAFVEGPSGELLGNVIRIAVGGLVAGGAAMGFELMREGANEQNQASEIYGETTFSWCQQSPGACSKSIDWNR